MQRMAEPDKPTEKKEAARPAEGLSQFLGRVLDQLSLTSWMPAAMLVGVGAILLQLRSQRNNDVAVAVQRLADKPLGTVIVLFFALILAAVITQAFSFEAIRFLEGYWGGSRLTAVALRPWVALRRRQFRKLHERIDRQKEAAFKAGKAAMLAGGMSRAEYKALKSLVFNENLSKHKPEVLREVGGIGWRWSSSPALLDALDRSVARESEYRTNTGSCPRGSVTC